MSYFANWQTPERRAQDTVWNAVQNSNRAQSAGHRARAKSSARPASGGAPVSDDVNQLLQEMLWIALQARSGCPRMHFYQVYHIVDLFRKASPCRSHWFTALRTFRFKHKLEVVFPDLLVTLAEFQGKTETIDIGNVRKPREDLLTYAAGLKDSNLNAQLRAAYATMNLK